MFNIYAYGRYVLSNQKDEAQSQVAYTKNSKFTTKDADEEYHEEHVTYDMEDTYDEWYDDNILYHSE